MRAAALSAAIRASRVGRPAGAASHFALRLPFSTPGGDSFAQFPLVLETGASLPELENTRPCHAQLERVRDLGEREPLDPQSVDGLECRGVEVWLRARFRRHPGVGAYGAQVSFSRRHLLP